MDAAALLTDTEDKSFERKVDSTLLFSTNSNYLYPTIYTDLYTKAYKIRQKNIKKVKEDQKAAEFTVQEGEISLHHESGESIWLKKKESSLH